MFLGFVSHLETDYLENELLKGKIFGNSHTLCNQGT